MLRPNVSPELSRMPPKSSHSYLKDIVIFGAGGLGREVLLLIHQINQVMPTWNILGFYDDNPTTPQVINQYSYLGTLTNLNAVSKPLQVAVAIGNPAIKAKIISSLTSEFLQYPVLLHPSVEEKDFKFNKIGEGTIICQGNILTTNIKIGKHVLLNLGCTIGHDAIIGDFCSLMPRVNLAGHADISKGVYLGTNATVLQNIKVGKNSIVGAGAVVIKDIPDNCTAVGLPAKVIKRHE